MPLLPPNYAQKAQIQSRISGVTTPDIKTMTGQVGSVFATQLNPTRIVKVAQQGDSNRTILTKGTGSCGAVSTHNTPMAIPYLTSQMRDVYDLPIEWGPQADDRIRIEYSTPGNPLALHRVKPNVSKLPLTGLDVGKGLLKIDYGKRDITTPDGVVHHAPGVTDPVVQYPKLQVELATVSSNPASGLMFGGTDTNGVMLDLATVAGVNVSGLLMNGGDDLNGLIVNPDGISIIIDPITHKLTATGAGGSGGPTSNLIARRGVHVDFTATPTETVTLALHAGTELTDATPYLYALTHQTLAKETPHGPSTTITITTGNQEVNATVGAVDTTANPDVVSRGLYRSHDGGVTFHLVTTLDLTAQTYLDNLTDATVDANQQPPATNDTVIETWLKPLTSGLVNTAGTDGNRLAIATTNTGTGLSIPSATGLLTLNTATAGTSIGINPSNVPFVKIDDLTIKRDAVTGELYAVAAVSTMPGAALYQLSSNFSVTAGTSGTNYLPWATCARGDNVYLNGSNPAALTIPTGGDGDYTVDAEVWFDTGAAAFTDWSSEYWLSIEVYRGSTQLLYLVKNDLYEQASTDGFWEDIAISVSATLPALQAGDRVRIGWQYVNSPAHGSPYIWGDTSHTWVSIAPVASGSGGGGTAGVASLNALTGALSIVTAGTGIAVAASGSTITLTGSSMVDPMSATGDLVYRASSGTTRLPIGTSGQVLTVSGGIPTWTAPTTGGVSSLNSLAGGLSIVAGTGISVTASGSSITISGTGTGGTGSGVTSANGLTGSVSVVGTGGVAVTSSGTTITVDGSGVTGGGGMANPMTTLGDLITGGTAGAPARLGIGSTGQVLTVSGGVPVWSALPASVTSLNGLTSGVSIAVAGSGLSVAAAGTTVTITSTCMLDPTTTKGDLIVHGTATTRLPVGTDGQVLLADSAQALGVRWAPVPASGLNWSVLTNESVPDLIYTAQGDVIMVSYS